MRKTLILFLSLLLMTVCCSNSNDRNIAVIPYPLSVETTDKVFDKERLDRISYKKVSEMSAEAYEIHIKPRRIVIRHSDDAGRFYAEQTLRQLAENEIMYCGVIKDEPRFEWRGFMLDEARHFFGKEKVKELLDLMARYKLNRFHWHLSDNQGWRIEIKAYPELCTIGAIGCHTDRKAPAKFYTQDEIREILAYAAERHIEVIPEIDMPGHATAFTKTFPHLNGGTRTVNPAKDELYVVLGNIIKELSELFPGRYIHIGGDEVSTKGWETECPDMKQFMEKENIGSYDSIQKYFEKRYSDIVFSNGKKAIAWDEVISSELDKENTILQWWRGGHPENLDKCYELGYKTIISPTGPFYLDYVQDIRCKEGHRVWAKSVNSLERIYKFDIKDNPLLLGVQANLWTERIRTHERLEYMIFPRLIAIAERGWTSQENLDYDDFIRRLEKEYGYLDSIGIYYFDVNDFDHHPEPLK